MRLPLLAFGVLSVAAGVSLPRPRTHVVEMRGMQYVPAELTASPGDTVLWINRDPVPHTATAGSANAWDTGEIAPGDTGRVVIQANMGSAYTCALHPAMRARVSVR